MLSGHLQENFGATLKVKEIDPVELENTTAPVYLFESPSMKYYKNHEVGHMPRIPCIYAFFFCSPLIFFKHIILYYITAT
jgi:hypothetical protein